MTDDKLAQFNQILESFGPAVRELAHQTRALIYDVLPQVVEVPWVQQKVIGYGTGTKKMSEHFAWIAPAKKHVTLGFYYGTDKLLEGTGTLLRHVKIRSAADLQRPGVRALLEAAKTHRVPPI